LANLRATIKFVGKVVLQRIEMQIKVGVETTLGIFDELSECFPVFTDLRSIPRGTRLAFSLIAVTTKGT